MSSDQPSSERPESRHFEQRESGGRFASEPQISMPDKISKLAERERASETNQAPPMNAQDKADLVSWRQFPHEADIRYRDLARKELLSADPGNPKLNPEERADLASKRQFPSDSQNQALAKRELLASLSPEESEGLRQARVAERDSRLQGKRGGFYDSSSRESAPELDQHYKDLAARQAKGETLNPAESADLASKRQFPYDQHYQDLARKELLSRDDSSARLSPDEYADLVSKRQFPNDEHYRELAKKEYLSGKPENPKLTVEERADLASKRQFPQDSYHQELARRELLALSKEEKDALASARVQRANRRHSEPDHLEFQ